MANLMQAVFLFSITAMPLMAQPYLLHRLNGSTRSPNEIDQEVIKLMQAARVTGLALSVLNNHQAAYVKTYGYANSELKMPLQPESVFSGASFSKAVFSYLCLKMVDAGKLNLDQPLMHYLPQPLYAYPRYTDLAQDKRWTLITARMCLNHTTGFPNWRFLHPYTGDYVPGGKLAIYFTPGSKYAYSGEGIALMQMVLEHITGRNLEDLAQEEIFLPLAMTRTSYIWQTKFETNYASGHDTDQQVIGKKKRTKPGAAGSLETTPEDMAKFIAHLSRREGLSAQSYNQMFSPQVYIHSLRQFPTLDTATTRAHEGIQLAYGLGWGLLNSPFGPAFFKEGHDEGWQHYLIHFSTPGTGLIIMTNSDNGEKIFKDLLEFIIGDTFTPWTWQRYWPYNYRN